MYYRYFGLQEEPFSIAVNPRYLFMSTRHRDALAHLLYGVGAGGGFILLTGEVGTGKTTINRCLLQQMPAETDIAIVLNPALNAEELLATVCDELGIEYPTEATLKDLTDRLHGFLLENHERGRNTVLLIDEAQHLQFDVLEQIRLLTNLETNTRKLLQIILVGQPELAAMLARPELRQISQRITARYTLQPLNLDETDAYIQHRLQVAGLPANQILFPSGVVRGIYRHSRGVPRIINLLCDRMLLGTYGQNKSQVDRAMLGQAVAEVMGKHPLLSPRHSAYIAAAAALLLVGLLSYPLWNAPGSSPAATGFASVQTEGWVSGRQEALSMLASHVGIEGATGGKDPCIAAAAAGWQCEWRQAETWGELLELDRPAVLALTDSSRFERYAVLAGVQGEGQGLWLTGQGESAIPLATAGTLWQGEYAIFWQPPEGYDRPFGRGHQGPVVSWLAAEFAALDGQDRLLSGVVFNATLDARVRLFQRQHGLRDDGVVGIRTLLKLASVRHADRVRLRRDDGSAVVGEG